MWADVARHLYIRTKRPENRPIQGEWEIKQLIGTGRYKSCLLSKFIIMEPEYLEFIGVPCCGKFCDHKIIDTTVLYAEVIVLYYMSVVRVKTERGKKSRIEEGDVWRGHEKFYKILESLRNEQHHVLLERMLQDSEFSCFLFLKGEELRKLGEGGMYQKISEYLRVNVHVFSKENGLFEVEYEAKTLNLYFYEKTGELIGLVPEKNRTDIWEEYRQSAHKQIEKYVLEIPCESCNHSIDEVFLSECGCILCTKCLDSERNSCLKCNSGRSSISKRVLGDHISGIRGSYFHEDEKPAVYENNSELEARLNEYYANIISELTSERESLVSELHKCKRSQQITFSQISKIETTVNRLHEYL